MTQDPDTTDTRPAPADGARRDLLLPVLLATAIMLAVWWYWRHAVVGVGERATQPSPTHAAPAEGAQGSG